jgi:multisubunit Na+/H+ antiporter MnhE subunit
MNLREKIVFAIVAAIAVGCIATNILTNYINKHRWLDFLMAASITYLIVSLIEVAKRLRNKGK